MGKQGKGQKSLGKAFMSHPSKPSRRLVKEFADVQRAAHAGVQAAQAGAPSEQSVVLTVRQLSSYSFWSDVLRSDA